MECHEELQNLASQHGLKGKKLNKVIRSVQLRPETLIISL